MIQTQMCQVFFDMFQHTRNGSHLLPTKEQILEAASLHPGILPYLSLRHPDINGNCPIDIFAPAWRQWLGLERSPRLQNEVMDAEETGRKARVLYQTGLYSCGFLEVGTFSFRGKRNFFVETLSLPAQSTGEVMNIFGFSVPLSGNEGTSGGERSPLTRQWLDLGHGVPDEVPESMLSRIS